MKQLTDAELTELERLFASAHDADEVLKLKRRLTDAEQNTLTEAKSAGFKFRMRVFEQWPKIRERFETNDETKG